MIPILQPRTLRPEKSTRWGAEELGLGRAGGCGGTVWLPSHALNCKALLQPCHPSGSRHRDSLLSFTAPPPSHLKGPDEVSRPLEVPRLEAQRTGHKSCPFSPAPPGAVHQTTLPPPGCPHQPQALSWSGHCTRMGVGEGEEPSEPESQRKDEGRGKRVEPPRSLSAQVMKVEAPPHCPLMFPASEPPLTRQQQQHRASE